MILIFGGAYQGKLDYTMERFQLGKEDIYSCTSRDVAMPVGKKVIDSIDQWILALIKADMDTDTAVREFIECNKDGIVLCNDISSGIVPIDPILRAWREAAGRMMIILGRQSEETIRMFCGIPTTLHSP